jgi:hypothetical protein
MHCLHQFWGLLRLCQTRFSVSVNLDWLQCATTQVFLHVLSAQPTLPDDSPESKKKRPVYTDESERGRYAAGKRNKAKFTAFVDSLKVRCA